MAYSRWGDSDWYIFWETTKADMDAAAAGRPKPKSEERLAIWRARQKDAPTFAYREVREMLESDDFARIAGFDEESRAHLRSSMEAFVADVDVDRARGDAT